MDRRPDPQPARGDAPPARPRPPRPPELPPGDGEYVDWADRRGDRASRWGEETEDRTWQPG